MKLARRMICLLLALLLAVPYAALGAVETVSVLIRSVMPDGTEYVAAEGLDYLWSYTDETHTAVWVQLTETSQVDPSRVMVEMYAADGQSYLFYDLINGTEWLDFSLVLSQPQAYALLNAYSGEPAESVALAVSYEPVPGAAPGGSYVDPVFPSEGGAELITPQPPVMETLPDTATGFVYVPAGTFVSDGMGGGYPLQGEMIGTHAADMFNDEYGALWVGVQFSDGTYAYAPLNGMSFITEADYVTATATPVPNQTLPDSATGFVRVSAGTYVSDGMGGSYPLSAEMLGTHGSDMFNDSTGALWVGVQFTDGTYAYAPLNGMTFISEADYVTATATPVPNQTLPPYESSYGRMPQGGTIYTAPGGQPAASLTGADVLQFTGSMANDSEGKLWLSVSSQLGDGYVLMEQMAFMTYGEEEAYLKSLIPQQTMVPGATGFVRVDAGTVLRDGSGNTGSVSSDTVGRYENDSFNDEEGRLWCRVSLANGQTGYVMMDMVGFIAEGEYIEATATPVPQETMPPHESNYGYMLSGGVLYDMPDGNMIFALSDTDLVRYDGQTAYNGKDGALWIRVEAGGTAGFVPVRSVTFVTKQQEQEILKTPEPTLQPTPQPTEQPTPVPVAPAVSGYARILSNNVAVRPSPAGAPAVSKVDAGQVVHVGFAEYARDGSLWYYCRLTSGMQGWVPAGDVHVMTPAEEQAYLQSLVTAAPIVTPSPSPRPLPTPTQLPAHQQTTGYKRVTMQGATLLAWPNVGGPSSRILNRGEAVYVQEQLYDQTGTLLDLARTEDGTWGYINTRYLTPMTQQEIIQYFSTPAPTPMPAPTYSTAAFSGYAMVTSANGGSVNFRTAPSMSNSSVITGLKNRSLVRVMGERSAEGYTWYQCEANGRAGYVRGDFLRLLSVSEYTGILASGNYTSNNATVSVTATAKTVTQTTWQTPSPATQTSALTFITIAPMRATATPTARPTPTLRPTLTPTTALPFVTPSPRPSATAAGAQGFGVVVTPTPTPLQTAEAPAEFPTEKDGGFNLTGLLAALAVLLVIAAGGFYGYSIYNKNRRRQAEERARKVQQERRQAQQNAAMRRPAPPVVPQGGRQQQPRYGEDNEARRTTTAAGAAYRREMTEARTAQSGERARAPQQPDYSAYARPVQDVRSSAPRATVDGKPVGDARAQQEDYRARTMPVAPPPTQADQTPVRRRRRAEHRDQENGEQ